MRLAEDKIKEAILHPDLNVRDTAIRYFHDSTDPDETIMPLAIEAIAKYGRTGAFSYTHYLNILHQTCQTIGWVIAELQRDFQAPPEERYFYFLNLSRLLCNADIRLVAPHAAQIFQAPHFNPKQRLALTERLEMFGWNAEKCWNALLEYVQANKGKKTIEEFNLDHALRIIEALARQPHEYQEQIEALLGRKDPAVSDDVRRWLRPLLANLAGKMRMRSAIPLLVSNLGHRDSFLSDQCLFALAEIGTEEVVTLVSDRFPHASRDFRLYASDLLCKIHLDVTVERVLRLLPTETVHVVQMTLYEALLDHFSSEGIELARQFIKRHELTPDLRHLRSVLVASCKIGGARFPDFDAWDAVVKRDRQAEQTKIREMRKMVYEAGDDLGVLVQRMKADAAKEQRTSATQAPSLAPRVIQSSPRLGHRPAFSSSQRMKVGRNDPCPCGSGKKFKTCCMRR